MHRSPHLACAGPHSALMVTAWTALDAAFDLRDFEVVEACRRVLDAIYSGRPASRRDLSTVLDFFA
ncbi:hypothetical protein ABIA96_003155 [Bradyrhizobium sp. LB11.1]|jgi:hypothetical protein